MLGKVTKSQYIFKKVMFYIILWETLYSNANIILIHRYNELWSENRRAFTNYYIIAQCLFTVVQLCCCFLAVFLC